MRIPFSPLPMERLPVDGQPPSVPPSRTVPSRFSRVGSAVKWTLASVLAAGGAGGVGYTVHRQNELSDEHAALRQTLSEEQMLREGLQRQFNEQLTLDDIPKAIDMVKHALVRVEGNQWLGSGTILTDRFGRMFILTNGHVTEENELRRGEGNDFRDAVYSITLYRGNDADKKVTFDAAPVILANGRRAHSLSSDKDIALLRIPPNIERQIQNGEIPVPHIEMYNRLERPLRTGDHVIVGGHPFGEFDRFSDGIISNPDVFGDIEPGSWFYGTTAPINGGNSGGEGFCVWREGGRLHVAYMGPPTWGYRGGDGMGAGIDNRVVALQCDDFGYPIASPGEIAAYRQWWNEVVVPFQKSRGIGGSSGNIMPPAHD